MQEERILVIGNGFDIAHSLPTKYNDNKKSPGVEPKSIVL